MDESPTLTPTPSPWPASAAPVSNHDHADAAATTCADPDAREWQARKRDMLADFARWLDELSADDGLAGLATPPAASETAGMLQLFGALTALRQDVRLAARQALESRQATEAGSATLQTIEKRLGLADAAVDSARSRLAESTWKGKAEMALDYVQLVESVERCQIEIGGSLPRFGAGRVARARLARTADMLALVMEKVALAMRDRQLRPTVEPGATFDPRSMRAVEVARQAGTADGTVAAVLRQGYELDGKPLRDAEVAVVRNR